MQALITFLTTPQGVALALLATPLFVDWLQTIQIAKHPERWFERNPILGTHPSVGRVCAWFALCAGGIAALEFYVPKPSLPWLMGLMAAMEWYWVINNWRLGIRLWAT